jgi:uncharacterized protein with HEPN domain
MKKDIKVFLEHILESINLIEEYMQNKTKTEFLETKQLQDAVIRRIEIIGEAVKNIPDDIKGKFKDIPWRNIMGMRDILIHQYFGVDLELTWEVINNNIPELKNQISSIKKKL